jgi:hypothetical protein
MVLQIANVRQARPLPPHAKVLLFNLGILRKYAGAERLVSDGRLAHSPRVRYPQKMLDCLRGATVSLYALATTREMNFSF